MVPKLYTPSFLFYPHSNLLLNSLLNYIKILGKVLYHCTMIFLEPEIPCICLEVKLATISLSPVLFAWKVSVKLTTSLG